MKFFLLSVLIVVLSFDFTSAKGAKCGEHYDPKNFTSCSQYFNIFHKCTGKFLEISLKSTNPFTLCTNPEAHGFYRNLTFWLQLLENTKDPKNSNVTCSDEYFNKNQMSVISHIVATSKGIWESAYCDDCYEGTPKLNQNFSEITIQFQNDYRLYNNCVSKFIHNHSAICQNCYDYYITLNNFFDHKKNLNGKICFDLEDVMNTTRQQWSVNFKCCKDKRDSLKAFYSLFTTIIILTLIFYVTVYITGSTYTEPELLDAQEISNNLNAVRPSTSSGSSSNDSSNDKPQPGNDLKKLIINDDSDDDNILDTPSSPHSTQLITLDN